jgi:SagB-type dehydrogenase family enzyme
MNDDNILPTPEDADIARLYHENTKVPPFEMRLALSDLPAPLGPDAVPVRRRLPHVDLAPGMSLEDAIYRRISCRSFDPRAMLPQAVLSRLIAFGGGYTNVFDEAPDLGFRRAAPSAGARYPIDLYPIVLRAENLAPGAYRYAVGDHSLELLRPGDYRQALAHWTLGQAYVADTSVVFALVGCHERIRTRYGERGYRYTLFEAGHIAQNLYLMGGALGLGVLAIGGFVDAALNRLLCLDEADESVVYLVAVGVPAAS